jgi:hypothetical protein
MDTTSLYWTFNTDEFPIIHVNNNYCNEEEILGERLYDKIDNNPFIPKDPSFTDWGFVFDFKYQGNYFVFIIRCLNINEKLFGIMIYKKSNLFRKLLNKNININEFVNLVENIIMLESSFYNIQRYSENEWIKIYKTKNIWEIH